MHARQFERNPSVATNAFLIDPIILALESKEAACHKPLRSFEEGIGRSNLLKLIHPLGVGQICDFLGKHSQDTQVRLLLRLWILDVFMLYCFMKKAFPGQINTASLCLQH